MCPSPITFFCMIYLGIAKGYHLFKIFDALDY